MSSTERKCEEVSCTPIAVGDLIPLDYDDEAVPLAPLDDDRAAAASRLSATIDLDAVRQRGETIDPWDRSDAEAPRYTLLDLFAATTAICMGFALARWLPAPIVAGVVGLAALIVLMMVSASKLAGDSRRLCWFAILALYFGAACMAIWQTWNR